MMFPQGTATTGTGFRSLGTGNVFNPPTGGVSNCAVGSTLGTAAKYYDEPHSVYTNCSPNRTHYNPSSAFHMWQKPGRCTTNPFYFNTGDIIWSQSNKHQNCKMMCCLEQLPMTKMRKNPPPLESFAERFASFSNKHWAWQIRQKPEDLAQAGLYCLGDGDYVKCVYCNSILGHWDATDDINARHLAEARRNRKDCRYITDVPLNETPIPKGIDNEPSENLIQYLRKRGNHNLESIQGRLETYVALGWPAQMKQSKEQLAEAGFYYLGYGDSTKCFRCDLVISDWLESDVPYSQHWHWCRSSSRSCAFVESLGRIDVG